MRKAAGRLFRERWIEDCVRDNAQDEDEAPKEKGASSAPSFDALLELLERIDVLNSGVENGIAMKLWLCFGMAARTTEKQ